MKKKKLFILTKANLGVLELCNPNGPGWGVGDGVLTSGREQSRYLNDSENLCPYFESPFFCLGFMLMEVILYQPGLTMLAHSASQPKVLAEGRVWRFTVLPKSQTHLKEKGYRVLID